MAPPGPRHGDAGAVLARPRRRPSARPSLVGPAEAGLLIVGGGFTGLWAAIQALQDDPSRDVVVLEGDRVGWGASGRNGGFCEASITHGEENGRSRWPEEFETLHRLGNESYAGLRETLDRHAIECSFEETGVIAVAREAHEIELADGRRRGGGQGRRRGRVARP